ncbi:MAG: hypothetical protein D6805_02475 [Planctomycetota bacterium]|nr:MAG: hypothetical protein D6805_02475 [Planctomycetota bacterium]
MQSTPLLKEDLQRHIGKYYGKYAGIVVDNKDKETDDQTPYGRIKVQVPSLFPPDQAVWARPCFPFAHFFVPDVGSRVWVEFEAGDLRYPIWSGFWYTNDEGEYLKPRKSNTEDNDPTNRIIRTPCGHEIELDDTGGEKEKINIVHRREKDDGEKDKRYIQINNKHLEIVHILKDDDSEDTRFFIDHDQGKKSEWNYKDIGYMKIDKKEKNIQIKYLDIGTITIDCANKKISIVSESGKDIDIESGQHINIKAAQNIKVEAGGNIDIKATGNISSKSTGNTSIEATGNFSTKSTGNTKIEATAMLDIKTSALGTVQASGILTLKGALVKIN